MYRVAGTEKSGWTTEKTWLDSRQGREILFVFKTFELVLEHVKSLIQWVFEVKRPELIGCAHWETPIIFPLKFNYARFQSNKAWTWKYFYTYNILCDENCKVVVSNNRSKLSECE